MIISILQNNMHVIVAILAVVTIILFIITIYLYFRVHKLTQGSNGKSLESTIHTIQDGQKEFKIFKSETNKIIDTIQSKLLKSIQAVATTRYDAFGGGGKQSSTTALLNEEGDGVVITSMKSNDRVSVYTKPIKKFDSEHSLSDEEDSTIKEARAQL